MALIKRVAVFCGASLGNSPKYAEAAKVLAHALSDQGLGLIYGGDKIGLMSVLADTMLARNAEVIGVIPQFLVDRGVAHQGLTQLYVVNSMHERKALMEKLADGFILFAGGVGSLDEFFELISWSQLGLHRKPCGILNVDHYFDTLVKFLDEATQEGFIGQVFRDAILVADTSKQLLQAFSDYQAPKNIRHETLN